MRLPSTPDFFGAYEIEINIVERFLERFWATFMVRLLSMIRAEITIAAGTNDVADQTLPNPKSLNRPKI